MGMWRDIRKPILLVGLFPSGTTRLGGGLVDAHRTLGCWELLGIGREPTWRLARRDRQEWHRRVGEATRPPVYAPHDWLIISDNQTLHSLHLSKICVHILLREIVITQNINSHFFNEIIQWVRSGAWAVTVLTVLHNYNLCILQWFYTLIIHFFSIHGWVFLVHDWNFFIVLITNLYSNFQSSLPLSVFMAY